MNEWTYKKPIFECDKYNNILLEFSPWSGHREFIYDFIAWYQPKKIVELGSHFGSSAFAIAQSIKDNKVDSKLYCIDTWQGDCFTENDYSELNVYTSFFCVKNKCYNDEIVMIRDTFDNAIYNFENNSIDLLHIDGSHIYEDVKNDFEKWKYMMKPNGVVIFHDISEDIINGKKMGSHIFWNELKLLYKNTFEFPHSFGLGLVFLSDDIFIRFKNSINPNKYINEYYIKTNELKDKIRQDYFKKIELNKYIEKLKEEKKILEDIEEEYKKTVIGKDEYIERLKEEKKILEDIEEEYKKTVIEKDEYIERLKEEKKGLEDIEEEYKKTVIGKDEYIERLKEEKKGLEDIEEEYKKTVIGKDEYIERLKEEKKGLEDIEEEYKKTVIGKDEYIERLKEEKKILEDIEEEYKKTVIGKDEYIERLKEEKKILEDIEEEYKKTVIGKDEYIERLKEEKNNS